MVLRMSIDWYLFFLSALFDSHSLHLSDFLLHAHKEDETEDEVMCNTTIKIIYIKKTKNEMQCNASVIPKQPARIISYIFVCLENRHKHTLARHCEYVTGALLLSGPLTPHQIHHTQHI